MTEKNQTWTSHKIRSVNIEDLSPEELADFYAQLGDIPEDGVISTQWSYSSNDGGEPFNLEMENGKITVKGQTYDSMDAVLPEVRQRIQAMRSSLADGGNLLEMLQSAGIDTASLPDDVRKVFGISADAQTGSAFSSQASQHFDHVRNAPDFVHDIDAPDFGHAIDETVSYNPNSTLSPGAVPRSQGRWKWLLLIVVLIGVAALVLNG